MQLQIHFLRHAQRHQILACTLQIPQVFLGSPSLNRPKLAIDKYNISITCPSTFAFVAWLQSALAQILALNEPNPKYPFWYHQDQLVLIGS